VTSSGSPHARFRRAVLTGNLAIIDAAARELPTIGLKDALDVLRVMAIKRDDRFERAAARFAARVTLERALSPADAHRVLGLATSLPEAPQAVCELLRGYC
jgi:hypothetical protein